MGRIFNYLGVVIDLGNIKHIEEKYANTCNGYPCDWYVQIELLNGNEYVLNPSTGETELIKPVIKIRCSDGSVNTVVKEISEQWEKHLESKEIGCGIAGFTVKEIAPLFKVAITENIENVYLPERFYEVFSNETA